MFELSEFGVDLVHEAVKMRPSFGLEGQGIKKGVDKVGLAPTHTTP
jgi:hypothetical protein